MTIVEFIAHYPPTSLKGIVIQSLVNIRTIQVQKKKSEFVSKMAKFLPKKPLEGPIKAELKFYEKRPKSHYRTGKFSNMLKKGISNINTSKRDIDNFVKFVLDSLNKKMYLDDSQIFEIICGKYYSDSDGYIECKFEEIIENSETKEIIKNSETKEIIENSETKEIIKNSNEEVKDDKEITNN